MTTLEQVKNALQSVKHILHRKAEAPNWQENNPHSLSYIKGRLGGYDKEVAEEVVLFDGIFVVGTDSDCSATLNPLPTVGKKYKIYCQDVEIEVEAINITANGITGIVLCDNENMTEGNVYMIGNAEVFILLKLTNPTTGEDMKNGGIGAETTIKIVEAEPRTKKEPVQFPLEYIPKHEDIDFVEIAVADSSTFMWADVIEQIYNEFNSGKRVFLTNRNFNGFDNYRLGVVLDVTYTDSRIFTCTYAHGETMWFVDRGTTKQLYIANLNFPRFSSIDKGKILGVSETGNYWTLYEAPKLTVELTYDGTANKWTADHTFDEIQDAISKGTTIEVSTANMKLPLASHDNSFLIFSGTVCTDKCYSRTATISSSAISYIEKTLLTTDDSGEGVAY